MKVGFSCCLLAAAFFLVPTTGAAETGHIRVILVGDSTMATRTGYGDALCKLFRPEVVCLNLARGGRSSGSFRAEGLWDSTMRLLNDKRGYRATYVLIQFGHNDQPGKQGRSTDLATEFPVNMARFVDETKSAGGIPVLLTPLARRTFRDGVPQNDLKPWAAATRRVADAKRVPLLDLNADSSAALAAMGSAEADTFAMAPPLGKIAQPDKSPDSARTEPNADAKTKFDYTHLGEKGAMFFTSMVATALAQSVPALAAHIKAAPPNTRRPQLTASQVRAYGYAEVLKYTGPAGNETIDPWDPLSDPLATGAVLKPDYMVDPAVPANGRTLFTSVQSAVSKAIADNATGQRKDRVYILVKPGIYRELLYVPPSTAPLTLYSNESNAALTRISANLDALVTGSSYAKTFGGQFAETDPGITAMYDSLRVRAALGTQGSAVAWIKNDGFQAKNITLANTYNKAHADAITDSGAPAIHRQAVALMVDDADKVQFENVRFEGFQDTLYLKSSAPARTVRSFLNKSYIEGNMDFIFGEGTAYFHQSEIKSLGDRPVSYALAPSTHLLSKFGFVFNGCRFTHDGTPFALAGNFKLARQWFRGQRCTPYGSVTSIPDYRCRLGATDAYDVPNGTISKGVLETVGKVIILNSKIGLHIDKTRPWADWNDNGTIRHRPVQYSSDDYWDKLVDAGIDPVQQLGYAAKKNPAEPFLAEYNSTDE